MIAEEDICDTVAHDFHLCGEKKKSVAVVFLEYLGYSVRVVVYDGYSVHDVLGVVLRQAQERHGVKVAFEFVFESCGEVEGVDGRAEDDDSLLFGRASR